MIILKSEEYLPHEMINIMYNTIIFDTNGKILPELKTDNNTFSINNATYTITTKIGYVYLPVNYSPLGISELRHKIFDLLDILFRKFPDHLFSSIDPYETMNDITIEKKIKRIDFEILLDINEKKYDDKFYWIIENIKNMPVTTKLPTEVNCHMHLRSLSSIIVDNKNLTSFPDRYKSLKFPSISDLNNNCGEPTLFNINSYSGIYLDLIKMHPYVNVNNIISKFESTPNGTKYHCVPYKLFKDIYTVTPHIKEDWQKLVLDSNFLDDDAPPQLNPYCFVTGAPIFELTYIFDIYQRDITMQITSNDADKYPNAVVLTNGNEVPIKDYLRTADFSKEKHVKAVREIDVDDNGNLIEGKEAILLNIKYTKKYDTPKCVFISPLFIHHYKRKDYDTPQAYFEAVTNSKVITYITDTGISVQSILAKLNIAQHVKDIYNNIYNNTIYIQNKTKNITVDCKNLSRYTGKVLKYDDVMTQCLQFREE